MTGLIHVCPVHESCVPLLCVSVLYRICEYPSPLALYTGPQVHVSYTHLSHAQVPRTQLCVHLCQGSKAFDADEVVGTEKAEWNGGKSVISWPQLALSVTLRQAAQLI